MINNLKPNDDWLSCNRRAIEIDRIKREVSSIGDNISPDLKECDYDEQGSEDTNRIEIVKPPLATDEKAEHVVGWIIIIAATGLVCISIMLLGSHSGLYACVGLLVLFVAMMVFIDGATLVSAW
jgi:hypothetical protein